MHERQTDLFRAKNVLWGLSPTPGRILQLPNTDEAIVRASQAFTEKRAKSTGLLELMNYFDRWIVVSEDEVRSHIEERLKRAFKKRASMHDGSQALSGIQMLFYDRLFDRHIARFDWMVDIIISDS